MQVLFSVDASTLVFFDVSQDTGSYTALVK
jgi:hypothetical protein